MRCLATRKVSTDRPSTTEPGRRRQHEGKGNHRACSGDKSDGVGCLLASTRRICSATTAAAATRYGSTGHDFPLSGCSGCRGRRCRWRCRQWQTGNCSVVELLDRLRVLRSTSAYVVPDGGSAKDRSAASHKPKYCFKPVDWLFNRIDSHVPSDGSLTHALLSWSQIPCWM